MIIDKTLDKLPDQELAVLYLTVCQEDKDIIKRTCERLLDANIRGMAEVSALELALKMGKYFMSKKMNAEV